MYESDEYYMDRALALARLAADEGDIPVGALVADEDGRVIGEGRNRRYVKTAEAGTCDFEGYDNHGRFLAVECKRPVGGKLSPAQEARINDINRKGGVAFVVHSGEEFLQKLKERHCI